MLNCSFAILLGRKVTLEAGQISIKRSIPSALKNTVKNQGDHDLLCQPLSYSNASIQDKLNAKIHMLKLLSPTWCYLIYYTESWKAMGFRWGYEGGPHDGIVALIRERTLFYPSLPFPVRTQWKGRCLHVRKRALTGNQTCEHLGLPSPELWEINACCLSHSVNNILLWQSRLTDIRHISKHR